MTGPLQVLALAVQPRAGSWSWIAVVSCVLVAYAVIPREIRKVHRLRALLADHAARERVEAIGEVTTRVAHQMRHQLGLIGLSLRRIDAHLSDGGTEDARIVREELENLLRAQEELRAVLSDDLQRVHATDGRSTWDSLLRGTASRIALLARERNVRLETELDERDLEGADGVDPARQDLDRARAEASRAKEVRRGGRAVDLRAAARDRGDVERVIEMRTTDEDRVGRGHEGVDRALVGPDHRAEERP